MAAAGRQPLGSARSPAHTHPSPPLLQFKDQIRAGKKRAYGAAFLSQRGAGWNEAGGKDVRRKSGVKYVLEAAAAAAGGGGEEDDEGAAVAAAFGGGGRGARDL